MLSCAGSTTQRVGLLVFLTAIFLATTNVGVGFASIHINPKAETLQPNLKVDSIVDLCAQLSSKILPKSEFETRKNYRARVIKDLQKFNINKLFFKVSDKIYKRGNKQYVPTYDAEKGCIEVVLPYASKPCEAGYGQYEDWLLVNYRTKFNGKYYAKNAYNREVEVQKVDFIYYGITTVNKIMYRHQVKLLPSNAKYLKENFGIIIMGRLSSDGTNVNPISKTVITFEPSISHPREGKSVYCAVNIFLEEVWVYNTKNGKIYAKIKMNTELKDD